MESGPDPDGQGLPLGFWAPPQEFFNILQNFQEIRRRKIGPHASPTIWDRCVLDPGPIHTYPRLWGRRVGRFSGGGFLENFAKY